MKNPFLILCAAGLLAGCTTVKNYESETAAGPAKPVDYPIYVYSKDMKVPRPFELIGTMRVSDTPFTVFGGSLEDVLNTLRQNAREKGADALQLTSVQSPEFQTAHYRVDASFLRFTDAWESIAISEEEMHAYLRTNAQNLDPIEGVWIGSDPMRSRLGIRQNRSKPGRDFVALVLSSKNPTWHSGDKKLDILRGERPGVYRGNYYLEDYQVEKVAFTLRVPPANRFVIQTDEESVPIIFIREKVPTASTAGQPNAP